MPGPWRRETPGPSSSDPLSWQDGSAGRAGLRDLVGWVCNHPKAFCALYGEGRGLPLGCVGVGATEGTCCREPASQPAPQGAGEAGGRSGKAKV